MSQAQAPAAVPAEKTFCPPERRKWALRAAILASALGFIDGSVTAIATPAIRADLDASLVDVQWIANAYMLTLSALLLVGGAAGDAFGLRRTFMSGIVLFVAASLACAAAPDPWTLILARALQGLGAAIMVPGSLALIAKTYPREERGAAIGAWAAASALTTALGPVLGGFVLSGFGDWAWRLIFAVNLPLGGLALLMLAKVPADRPETRKKLDLAGAALATLALGLLAWGLTGGEGEGGGGSPVWWPALLAGAALLVAFVLWERRTPAPMVKLDLFRNRAFAGANLATFFLYAGLSAVLFFLPMLVISAWGVSEAQTSLLILPFSLVVGLLSGFSGRLADRIGPRIPIAAGSLLVAMAFVGWGFLALADGRNFWAAAVPLMLLFGVGMGLVVSPLSAAVMGAVEDVDTGSASGVNNAVSRVAGLFAVAAFGTLAAQVHGAWLASASLPPENLPGFGAPAPGNAASRAAWVQASGAGFSALAFSCAALAALAALIAWVSVPGRRERPSLPEREEPAASPL
ncbi:MAG TPA: MFS transporter [Mesorhizobium sp.]|jgi:EmrB/QacA subfamily drug resistance transporter|nr:MFS transporter [Mesorhizobium sp.]